MGFKTFFSCMLAFLQMLGITFGVIDIGEPDIDYGGDPYSAVEINEYLTLIADGRSDYVIIVGAQASPAELKAAQELQSYLYQMSGVELTVRNDTSRVIQTEIIIGKTSRESNSTFSVNRANLGEEGFLMTIWEERLVIAGGGARGTLYGVYTFLEEQLGCRWFTDTLTVVPERSEVKINKRLFDVQQPGFNLRYTDWKGSTDFKYKNKANYGGDESLGYGNRYATGCHSMPQLVPDSLFETDSDIFAYRKDLGARTVNHVCLSNPKALSTAIESARRILNAAPSTVNFFYVGQKDNQEYCQCEKCEAAYHKYESTAATMVMFVNQIATALKDEFPGISFTFLAYQDTREAPKGLECASNVIPTVCTIEACYVHPYTECGHEDKRENENFEYLYSDHEPAIANDLKEWAAISQSTHSWEYTVNFLNSVQFFADLHTLSKNMQYLQSLGYDGLFEEGVGYSTGEFGELRTYLILKLMWDPNCDVEYHMMDFMNAYYGSSAAKYIKEYIDRATHKIANTTHAFCFDWHYQIGYFNVNEISYFDKLWDSAEAVTTNETQLENVKRSRLQLRYYKANLFLDEFSLFNPMRVKENEKLYDDLVADGITRVTAFSPMPEKSTINFFLTRPIDWR